MTSLAEKSPNQIVIDTPHTPRKLKTLFYFCALNLSGNAPEELRTLYTSGLWPRDLHIMHTVSPPASLRPISYGYSNTFSAADNESSSEKLVRHPFKDDSAEIETIAGSFDASINRKEKARVVTFQVKKEEDTPLFRNTRMTCWKSDEQKTTDTVSGSKLWSAGHSESSVPSAATI